MSNRKQFRTPPIPPYFSTYLALLKSYTQTAEMVVASATTITARLAMLGSDQTPETQKVKESMTMFSEKSTAISQSMMPAMALQMSLIKGATNLWQQWTTSGTHSLATLTRKQMTLYNDQLSQWDAVVRPFHRKATSNARRLGKR